MRILNNTAAITKWYLRSINRSFISFSLLSVDVTIIPVWGSNATPKRSMESMT